MSLGEGGVGDKGRFLYLAPEPQAPGLKVVSPPQGGRRKPPTLALTGQNKASSWFSAGCQVP